MRRPLLPNVAFDDHPFERRMAGQIDPQARTVVLD